MTNHNTLITILIKNTTKLSISCSMKNCNGHFFIFLPDISPPNPLAPPLPPTPTIFLKIVPIRITGYRIDNNF